MKRLLLLILVTCVLCAAPPALKQGMDPGRLAQIPVRLKEIIDNGEIAGSVILLQRHGEVVLFEAQGWQDIEGRKPMRPDSIFQIMSMTKPFTGTAIMLLAEEGRLSIVEPVEKYLPEFKGMTVGGQKPARPLTVRDLMTHTGGMPGPTGELKDLYQKMDRTLAEAVAMYAKQPLDFDPGARWSYSNTGIATLGRIVEVVSGMPFERFIATRILEPLGMKDTFFFPPADKQDRIALVYRRDGSKLVRADATILGGDSALYRKGAKYSAPEFGMYSTAADLAKFYQMMLKGGVSGGKQYLSRAAVETMTTSHTGDLKKAGHLPGGSFGLTWEVLTDPLATSLLLSTGTFHHGGAFGTHGWVDRSHDIVGVFMTQRAGEALDIKYRLFQMIGASIVE